MTVKTAYFDCAFGAAGDMLVAACIDCGVAVEYIQTELSKLNLPVQSFATTAGKVHRASIHATKFDVWLDNKSSADFDGNGHSHTHEHELERPDPHSYDDGHAHGHTHEHAHDHDAHEHCHEHSHEHSHEHIHEHPHLHEHDHSHSREHSRGHENLAGSDKPERALSEILRMIADSTLEQSVKRLASQIFERLGRAEAAVHGVPVDQIHFHEVGALDAICDIVGFAIAFKKLGIEYARVSPLPLGSGTVQTMHGRFPVPGPAVLALLKEAGAMTSSFSLPYECLTPTGAAILCTVAGQFGSAPGFQLIEQVGYGAGSLNPGDHPNVVRLVVGQGLEQKGHSKNVVDSQTSSPADKSSELSYQAEVVAVIEANIDDLAPPVMAYAMEKLLQEGALDVSLTPIVMKKGRLAQKLTVIARPSDRDPLTALILAETTTIGARSYFCERLTLSRDFQQISIGDGPKIQLKIARDGHGRLVNVQPEYDDCLAFAKHNDMPLKEVLIRSLSKANELLDSPEKG